MARSFGFHELELNHGVQADDFEKVLQEIAGLPQTPGVQVYFLKGDRGVRDGKYMMVIEFESVERRLELWPRPDEPGEEVQRWFAGIQYA